MKSLAGALTLCPLQAPFCRIRGRGFFFIFLFFKFFFPRSEDLFK